MNTPYLSFVAVLFPLPSRYCHHHVDRVLLSGCLTRLASEQCCQTPQRQAMFLYSLLLITIFLDLSTYLETASVYVGTCTRISNTSTHVNNDRDRGCWKPHCKVAYSLSLKLVTFALLRTIWRFPITHGPCLLVLTSCLSFFLPSYPCICPDLFKQTWHSFILEWQLVWSNSELWRGWLPRPLPVLSFQPTTPLFISFQHRLYHHPWLTNLEPTFSISMDRLSPMRSLSRAQAHPSFCTFLLVLTLLLYS